MKCPLKLQVPLNLTRAELVEKIRDALDRKNPDLTVEQVIIPSPNHCYVKLDKVIVHADEDRLWFERSERRIAFELVPRRCKHVKEVL